MKSIARLINEYPYPLAQADKDAAELGISTEGFLILRDEQIRQAIAEGIFAA